MKSKFFRFAFLLVVCFSVATISFAQQNQRPAQKKAAPPLKKPAPQKSAALQQQQEAARDALRAGMRHRSEKKYAEAIAAFAECLRLGAAVDRALQPEITRILSSCLVNRGYTYAVTGDYDLAVADYKEGLKDADQAAELYSSLGDVAKRKKQLPEAIDFFSQAARAAPADPKYLVARAYAYLEAKNEQLALADFTRSLEINPFVNTKIQFKISADAPPFEDLAIRAYAGRSVIHKSNKNYQAAIADYASMLAFNLDARNRAFAYYNRAESYRLTKNYNQAVSDYRKTLEIVAADDRIKTDFTFAAKSGLGKIYAESGDRRSAIAAYTEALAIKPGDRETTESLARLQTTSEPQIAEDFLKRGKERLYERRTEESIADFSRAIELDSKLAEAYLQRGKLYALMRYSEKPRTSDEKYQIRKTLAPGETTLPKTENSLKALADLTKTIELDPQSAEAYRLRGLIYKIEEDYEPSAADFRSYLKLKPDDAGIQSELKLAEKNFVEELFSQTKKTLERAIGTEDEGERRKLYEWVIAASAKIIQSDSSNFIIYERRGDAYNYTERFDSAEADYSRVLQTDPNDKYILTKRAAMLVKLKKYDRAHKDYERLFAMITTGTNSNFLLSSAYTGRGELHLAENKYDQAIADFDSAVKNDPRFSHNAHYLRGLARLKKGERQLAIEDFKKALELNPNFTKAKTELINIGVAQ